MDMDSFSNMAMFPLFRQCVWDRVTVISPGCALPCASALASLPAPDVVQLTEKVAALSVLLDLVTVY